MAVAWLAGTGVSQQVDTAAAARASVPSALRADLQGEPLVQELFVSEMVTTQERGEIQITGGSSFRRSAAEWLFRSQFKSEYGITGRLQLESDAAYEHRGNSGFEDVSAGLRYALLRNLHQVAVTAGIGLNTLNSESAAVQLQPSVVVARRFKDIQVQAGAAMTVTGLRENRYSSAFIYPKREWRWTMEAEAAASEGKWRGTLVPGVVRSFRGFEFGVGLPVQAAGPTGPRFAPMVMITREFRGERD